MNKAYKFLNSVHVDSVLSGNFRCGSYESYRTAESAQIRDVDEGRSFSRHSKPIIAETAEARARLRTAGADVGPGATFTDCTFIKTGPRAHMFCYSYGPFPALKAKWAGYNACIEIVDPNALAVLMYEAGWIDIRRLKPMVKWFHHKPISYNFREGDLSNEGMLPVDMFQKKSAFAGEMESRIAFGSLPAALGEVVMLSVPGAAPLLKRVF